MNDGATTCLMIPGLGNSTEGHWQTNWERVRADCRRVELGHWHAPVREIWVGRIDAAIAGVRGPVVLVAHSLGCTAIAWWAESAGAERLKQVRGAMLVAPPDLARADAPVEVAGFCPTPARQLPFPSVVVASSDDPYASTEASRAMAEGWGATFVDIGAHAHMNAAAGLGDWAEGQAILDGLIDGGRKTLPALPRSG